MTTALARSEATLDRASLARWRRSPVAFIEEALVNPETGKPFELLPAERAFLAYAFLRGSDGRLLYPELLYACPKKSGKTTFAAIFTITVVVLFGGHFPEAICCANSFDQSAGRVFLLIKRIIVCSPLLRHEAKITEAKISIAGGSIIAIPSDYSSAAGANPCASVFDELWAYVGERARRLFDELVPPPTRLFACRFTVTYAGFERESELLEELYKRGLKQRLVGVDLYAGDGMLMFWSHVPIAPWQDKRWLVEMGRSLRPNQYLRMIENRFVTTESTFVDMDWFDACVDRDMTPVVADRSLQVFLGIDASVKRDSTAIVAVTFDIGAKKVRLVAHRIFQPSAKEPLDFEGAIENTVLDMRSRYAVRGVFYDPYQMASTAQRLAVYGVPMREFAQSVPNLTAIGSNLFELIKGQGIAFYPDDAIRLAISRTIALDTPRGMRLAKEKSSHKIDFVIALAMAALGAVQEGQVPQMRMTMAQAEEIERATRMMGGGVYSSW